MSAQLVSVQLDSNRIVNNHRKSVDKNWIECRESEKEHHSINILHLSFHSSKEKFVCVL